MNQLKCSQSVFQKPELNRRDWLVSSALATTAVSFRPDLCLAIGNLAEEADGNNIWDNHCHLSGVSGETPAERMNALLEYADRCGIARLIVYMGWPFAVDPDPAELRRQNDQVLAALEGHEDRVLAYAYVSGNHPAASLKEIHRLVETGPMVGIKLWVAQRCDDAAVDDIIAATAELDAIIFQHSWIKTTGNLAGESTPADVASLAQRHPNAKLICGHAGGNWELGIRAIRPYKNILLGTAGCDPTVGLVEMAVRELGADRIIFGSDAGGRSFSSQLSKIVGAGLSDQQQRMILGGNLRRLLGSILATKGVSAK